MDEFADLMSADTETGQVPGTGANLPVDGQRDPGAVLEQAQKPRGPFGGISGRGASDATRDEIVSVTTGTPLEVPLQRNPIPSVKLVGRIKSREPGKPDVSGNYNPITGELKIDRNSSPHRGYGQPIVPGRQFVVADVATTHLEHLQKTFVHEVGHHLLTVTWSQLAPTVNRAYAEAMAAGRVFTKYGEESFLEYFSETLVAYLFHPSELKAFDLPGYNLIEKVLSDLQQKGGE